MKVDVNGTIFDVPDDASVDEIDQLTKSASPAPQQKQEASPAPSKTESFLRGAGQGATLGFGDELSAGAGALLQKLFTHDPESFLDLYRRYRESDRGDNERAQAAHPGIYTAGQVAGTIPLTVATGGKGGALNATKNAVVGGAAAGGIQGLGESKADLTKGEVGQALWDATKGEVAGALGGAAGAGIAKGVSKIPDALTALGESSLFKAAVGQSTRAYRQVNGKGLLLKAGEYLNKMGIGTGDSTESIASKLGQKQQALTGELDKMVGALDAASMGTAKISPVKVANRVESEVLPGLNRNATMAEHEAVSKLVADLKTRPAMGFADAAAERRALQGKANYQNMNPDIMDQARQKIAQIWNETIDQKAEPFLKQFGKSGDAYKELRHETGLVTELLNHTRSTAEANAAKLKMASPMNVVMGAAGLVSSHPWLGLAAAGANYLAHKYGDAAAGRTAIGLAKALAASGRFGGKVTSAIGTDAGTLLGREGALLGSDLTAER